MIVLLISIVAIGLTVLLYYKSLALAPLRILAIILLYILITGFVFSVKLKKESNAPAILIDYSTSMTRYFPIALQEIDKIDFPHSLFFFNESLTTTIPEHGSPSGRFTDITGAISKVNKLQPSAIILISDGNHNFGESPLSIIKDINTPVYCFGVGSESQRDQAIIEVLYPEYAFIGDSVKIEVIIQSQGFEGGNGRVRLKSGQKKADQNRSFFLSDVKAKNKIDFWVFASKSGKERFSIYLAPQSGEVTYENNEFEFSFNILKNKIKVFYYTEHLSFNTKFMLRTLEQDNHIDFHSRAQISKNKYLNLSTNQKRITLPALNEFNVLILDNINLSKLPWNNIEKLLQQGLGILCMGATQGYTPFWRDVLPINTTDLPIKGNYKIKIIEPFSCLVPGDDYPPLTYINRVTGVKENTVIIAETNHLPIIAYRSYGRGVVFQFNGINIGTWHFLHLGMKQKNILLHLIGDIIRFLSPAGKNKRLILKSLHKDYNIGETIELTLQSFDRNFRLTGGGDFYIEFDKKRIPFFEENKGIYKTSFIADTSGNFKIKASGKLNEEILNSNELEIIMSTIPIEIEQGLNKEFLLTLSAKTGGKYLSIDEFDTFKIPVPKRKYIFKKIDFDSPISYFIILCLLAIDWFVRRRQGII